MMASTPPPIRIRMISSHAALIASSVALLSGCTVINVGAGQTADITSVGIVRVRVPVLAEGLFAIERAGAGIGWDTLPGGGAYLGWSDARWIMADPSQCQLLIVIRTPGQANHTKDILSKLKGQSLCVVDQSASLQP